MKYPHHSSILGAALISGAALALIAASTLALPSVAHAAPARSFCVPKATGVPTMEGPPQWVSSWSATRPLSTALDDPRWRGAAGHSFELGSATAPLTTRAVWSDGEVAGKAYLFLSFVVDVTGHADTDSTSPRDIFVGFRRSAPLPSGDNGYIFRFRLDETAAAGLVTPTSCDGSGHCADGNYWRVYTDFGNVAACGGDNGQEYRHGSGEAAAVPWMSEAVRYWKLAGAGPFLGNRWAVQVRFPMVAPGLELAEGIDRDSTFWYEARTNEGGAAGGGTAFLDLGWWPRQRVNHACVTPGSDPETVVHKDLTNPDNYGRLTLYQGAIPTDGSCDRGVSITAADIGSIFEAASGINLLTSALGHQFKALKADGLPGTNTVVARVTNNGAAVNAPLLARFRLAGWGAAPWSVSTDFGQWKDVRAVPNGVCGTGAAPACAPTSLAAGGKLALSFPWTIGNDTGAGGIGASEYCKYGLTPPAGAGACSPTPCACTAAEKCDVTGGQGVRASKPSGGFWPCVSSYYKADQCMLVELSAPNGGVDFEVQSAWHNMSFGQMSVMEREALIDGRGLPVAQGQKEQDIYLIAMPRNMPQAFPGGTTTGNQLVAERSFQAARRITDGYRESYDKTPEEERRRIAARFKRQPPDPARLERGVKLFGEEFLRAERIRAIIDPDDYRRADHLLDLATRAAGDQVSAEQITQEVYDRVGPRAAAEIVPTLEIYAYYRPFDQGTKYLPMTSFAVFLSHQGAMNGIDWELDGVTRVGPNVYRLRVPVGHARQIRVRSQAIEPGELVQKPGDPRWPCGGCCGSGARCGVFAGLNNMTPTLLGGVFLFGPWKRRRRRKGAQDTK